MILTQNNFNSMDMVEEWKRKGYQKKLWNGVHHEEKTRQTYTYLGGRD
jgi:hypothetical protein